MELAIGALELQNSLYFSLFAGNCVGDRFAGDCFHHHFPAQIPALHNFLTFCSAAHGDARDDMKAGCFSWHEV